MGKELWNKTICGLEFFFTFLRRTIAHSLSPSWQHFLRSATRFYLSFPFSQWKIGFGFSLGKTSNFHLCRVQSLLEDHSHRVCASLPLRGATLTHRRHELSLENCLATLLLLLIPRTAQIACVGEKGEKSEMRRKNRKASLPEFWPDTVMYWDQEIKTVLGSSYTDLVRKYQPFRWWGSHIKSLASSWTTACLSS